MKWGFYFRSKEFKQVKDTIISNCRRLKQLKVVFIFHEINPHTPADSDSHPFPPHPTPPGARARTPQREGPRREGQIVSSSWVNQKALVSMSDQFWFANILGCNAIQYSSLIVLGWTDEINNLIHHNE